MILYGSQTSPFVRRIRLLLPSETYEFKRVDIFNREERDQLRKLSPLLKIPMLSIDDQIIWDSRVIFNELCKRKYHPPLNINEENLLTAMSDLSDSLIQKLLATRSKVSFPSGTPLEISHSERIQNTLTFLEYQCSIGNFSEWNFISMCLYCLIDWINFRNLIDLSPFPILIEFKQKNINQDRIELTDPRIK